MRVLKNSANSPRFSAAALAGVILLLAVIGITAARWYLARGYSLYDGDAESHLDIARRILDSRTPGWEQLGTVWLPLPHLLMVPFAMHDAWWRSGATGAIPSCACFILAGAFLYAAARRMNRSEGAGLAAALIFAFNPNMLYLQSTPMTEPVQMAAVAALVWATLWFRDTQSTRAAIAAAVASNAASLTRYESWFLIPFVCLYFLVIAKDKRLAILFGALAGVGPLLWLAQNFYYYRNAFEFYNGPYSAMAIYRRQLAQGLRYPTDHNWASSILYYRTAARLVVGRPALIAGIGGAIVAIWKRAWWPLALLLLVPLFFVWSLHSGGAVITLPQLGPFSFYNTRYAIAVLPLAALAAGALVALLPERFQIAGAVVLAVGVSLPMWMASGSGNPAVAGDPAGDAGASICWKEARENSELRRGWTVPAAGFLEDNYRRGSGILFTFGRLSEVLRRAGIPLREGFHEGNGRIWGATLADPGRLLHEEWALAIPDDMVSDAIVRADGQGMHYRLRDQISVKGAPMVEIYHREPVADPIH